jgi:hypothetical protein
MYFINKTKLEAIMKTLICISKLLLLISILIPTLQAQIPNYGFEVWTPEGEPEGWLTTNFPPLIVNVTQTNISRTGNWAAKGEVIDVMMFPMPPLLNTGSQTSLGFPVNNTVDAIMGYFQFSPVGGDHFFVSAEMGIATTSDTTIIGAGAISIGDAVSSYAFFGFDIDYFLPGDPNWANITISIIDPSGTTSGHIGSYMLVDDLEIIVGVDDSEGNLIVKEFMLRQNYPNPFNPATKIKYQIPELSFVTIKVFDVLGNEITTLVNEEKPIGIYEVEFDGTELTSGIYFYQLQAEDFVFAKKMMLIK